MKSNLEKNSIPTKNKVKKWSEQTEKEALKFTQYLDNDVQEMAEFLVDAEEVIDERLTAKLNAVEEELLHMVTILADKSTIETLELQEDLKHHFEYQSGDIFGMGILQCNACDQLLHFQKANTIPPCPKCHKTSFHRLSQ